MPELQEQKTNHQAKPALFNKKTLATIFASTFTAALETFFLAPVDCAKQNAMNSNQKITYDLLKNKFRQNPNLFYWIERAYSGAPIYLLIKIFQRNFQFVGQAVIAQQLGISNHVLNEAMSGMIASWFELWLLPMDRLKVLTQLGHGSTIQNFHQMSQEGLYRQLFIGLRANAMRNSVGSSSFFGLQAYLEQATDLHNKEKSVAEREFTRSYIAFITSFIRIISSHPFDAIKVRQQADLKLGNKIIPTVVKMVREEGMGVFNRGLGVKGLASIVKLWPVAYSVSFFKQYFQQMLEESSKPSKPSASNSSSSCSGKCALPSQLTPPNANSSRTFSQFSPPSIPLIQVEPPVRLDEITYKTQAQISEQRLAMCQLRMSKIVPTQCLQSAIIPQSEEEGTSKLGLS